MQGEVAAERVVQSDVRQRLEALVRERGEGYAALSRLLGRNPAYIQQFIKRGVPRRLTDADRRLIARHFGVSEGMLGGSQSPPAILGPEAAAHELGDSAQSGVLVPVLDPAAMGAKGEAPTLVVDCRLALRVTGGRMAALAFATVAGDSMVPTLVSGDQVLVDRDDCQALRDGIYAIAGNGTLLIKRVSVHPVSRRLAVLSDNSAYPSFPDCDPADMTILGRVIWVGRSLA